mmetsp:Transcript_35434/g.92067  ORF Transcript_35434/g.92067 Transcript_35434/m.92067 type:complete len:314 (-) Transcript_35434:129-1070(-)
MGGATVMMWSSSVSLIRWPSAHSIIALECSDASTATHILRRTPPSDTDGRSEPLDGVAVSGCATARVSWQPWRTTSTGECRVCTQWSLTLPRPTMDNMLLFIAPCPRLPSTVTSTFFALAYSTRVAPTPEAPPMAGSAWVCRWRSFMLVARTQATACLRVSAASISSCFFCASHWCVTALTAPAVARGATGVTEYATGGSTVTMCTSSSSSTMCFRAHSNAGLDVWKWSSTHSMAVFPIVSKAPETPSERVAGRAWSFSSCRWVWLVPGDAAIRRFIDITLSSTLVCCRRRRGRCVDRCRLRVVERCQWGVSL